MAGRICVVEDDAMLREVWVRYLRLEGFEVLEASDGVAALQLVSEHLPNVVLMDLGLPVLDGWEVAKVLKKDPRTAQIPIIAITGHVFKTGERDAVQAGCDAFVRKPCELDALAAIVQRVVRLASR